MFVERPSRSIKQGNVYGHEDQTVADGSEHLESPAGSSG